MKQSRALYIGALLLGAAISASAQSTGDSNFTDIVNKEHLAVFGTGWPVQHGDTSGVEGYFLPPTYSLTGGFDPYAGQPSELYKIVAKVQRRLLKGRVALLAGFQKGFGGRNMGTLEGAHFKVIQGGQAYFGLRFNSGQPGGFPADMAWSDTSPLPIGTISNPGALTTVILAQDPYLPKFDPLKAFELQYIGANLSQPQRVVSLPDYPTLTAEFQPASLTTGQRYTIRVNSTSADAVRMTCTGAQATDEALPTGSYAVTRTATETGTTTCVFSALSNAGGRVTKNATRTVSPAAPTVSAYYSPNPVNAGSYYTLTTNTSNATSLTGYCVGAYTGSANLTPGANVRVDAMASNAYIGETTCTLTATGPGGSAQTTIKQQILPPLPTVSASYTPNPVKAGSVYTLTTSTSNATSLTGTCTGAYTGPANLTAGANIQVNAIASAVGTTTCTLTATGPGGSAQTVIQQVINP